MNNEILIKAAMMAFLALATTPSAFCASHDSATSPTEKCYGLVKTGMNDCATATSSCAGTCYLKTHMEID